MPLRSATQSEVALAQCLQSGDMCPTATACGDRAYDWWDRNLEPSQNVGQVATLENFPDFNFVLKAQSKN
jgi:hypothetical protein